MVDAKHVLIKDNFKLDENEQIFFEFSCSLSQVAASLPGMLYVTEHYLCYSCDIFGIESKVSVFILRISICLNSISSIKFNHIPLLFREKLR